MPGTNSAGYPYPLGTEPISQGDDAIHALATALPWLQGGGVTLVGDATNERTVAVTFPKAFPATPLMLVSAVTASSNSGITQSVAGKGASPTGFTASATRSNTTNVLITWLAVYLGGAIPG